MASSLKWPRNKFGVGNLTTIWLYTQDELSIRICIYGIFRSYMHTWYISRLPYGLEKIKPVGKTG